MKIYKKFLIVAVIAATFSQVATGAFAQDQRTSNQEAATVRVTAMSYSPDVDKTIRMIAKRIGIKLRHPSKKVWLLTGQVRQIQSFHSMAGGLGLTLSGK